MSYDLVALGETMLALAPAHGTSLRTPPACSSITRAPKATPPSASRGSVCAPRGSVVSATTRPATRILDALSKESVDTRWVRRDPRRPTGMMLKDPDAGVRYYRTGSAASAMGPDILDGVPVADARAVLVTGVTALIGDDPHAAGLALLSAARGLRIVDPNLRSGLWGSDRAPELVRPFIERCDLLLAGDAELGEIVGAGWAGGAGKAGARERLQAARAPRQRRIGPREVVVRGAASIGVLAGGSWTAIEIRRDAAVDPIGAGDAFNAGYIAVRIRGGHDRRRASSRRALRSGGHNLAQ